jgi:hypothetical protein
LLGKDPYFPSEMVLGFVSGRPFERTLSVAYELGATCSIRTTSEGSLRATQALGCTNALMVVEAVEVFPKRPAEAGRKSC